MRQKFDATKHSDDACTPQRADITHQAGEPLHESRPDAANAPRSSSELAVAVLDSLLAEVALLDSDGTILLVNETWRTFGPANGLTTTGHAVGTNYLDVRGATGDPDALKMCEGIRRVLAGTLRAFDFEYAFHAPEQQRWFLLKVRPLAGPASASCRGGAVVTNVEITDRRRVAAELARMSLETQRRERMFGGMLSASADVTYAIDRQRRFIYANDATLQIWGMPLEEAVGRTPKELGYPQELCDRLEAQMEQVFASRAAVIDETPFRNPAGQLSHFEYILSPAPAADGSVDFVVGSARNITRRKRTEEALHESVTEFRTLAAALPQIVWTSFDGKFTMLNARWSEYSGRSLADGLDRGWLEQVHPEDRARTEETARSWDQHGLESSVELRLAGADGTYRWWLLRGVPLKGEDGKVHRCLGTFTDIDDLKHAEAEILRANRELQRQRTELRTLFDLVPAMVWFKDTAGRVLQVNERAADAMGLSVDESLGVQISDVYPDSARRYDVEDRRMVRTGRPLLGIIEQVEIPDGRRVWVQSDKVPYRDENGQIIGLIVMKHDITARKEAQDALNELNATLEARVQQRTEELAQAREEAERANKAKSSFLATMSHEIRTPMTGMLGLLELLELTPLDEEQSSTLAVVRESGQSLQRIIDGILDFSKIEADSLELDVAPASIRDVVATVCSLYGPAASAKGLQLQGKVAPGVGQYLQLDATRLGQILNNFISNAIKFTHRGTVDVTVEQESRTARREQLRITVRDTGIGIPEEKVSGLFQPFAQADAHTGTEFGGTGLGLFIASRLAELMGGDITLESKPGLGTSLTLRATFEKCADDFHPSELKDAGREGLTALVARRPTAPGIEEAEQRGTLLLVVDDHPTNRMVLLRQAATLGYAAVAAADGQDALAQWRPGRFGAVLTDCNMPHMNGFQLAAAIREREARTGVHTPIIGCTANAMAEAGKECLAAGMDDIVTKPVALAELFAKLNRWLLPGAGGAPAPAPQFDAQAAGEERSRSGLPDSTWLAMIAGGEDAIPEVIADFRRCNDADAARLRQACADADLTTIGQFAHRVAGACAMLGAARLGTASQAVHFASGQDMEAVTAAMKSFEHEFAHLTNYLDSRWT